MKINELLPSELVETAVNMFRGTLSEKNVQFLKSRCGIEFKELYFCEDSSLELEVEYLATQSKMTFDLGRYAFQQGSGFGSTPEGSSYYLNALCLLLTHLGDQLPSWTYDESHFDFNWGLAQDATLDEFDSAYHEVWDMVFAGKRPDWRTGKESVTRLESLILNRMFGIMGENSHAQEEPTSDNLPTWLRDSKYPLPIDRDLLIRLQEAYKELNPQPENAERYISPFTGQET